MRPPHSFLPPAAQPWGRWVTSSVEMLVAFRDRASSQLRLFSAQINGKLNVTSGMLNRLYARRITTIFPANTSVSTMEQNGFAMSPVYQIPVPEGASWVTISINMDVATANDFDPLLRVVVDGVATGSYYGNRVGKSVAAISGTASGVVAGLPGGTIPVQFGVGVQGHIGSGVIVNCSNIRIYAEFRGGASQ